MPPEPTRRLLVPDHAASLGVIRTSEELKHVSALLRTAFPDGRWATQEHFTQGDRIVAHFTFQGTHLGPYLGIPPTGRQVLITGLEMFRIARGRITELWINWDALGLLEQLGALPSPSRPTD